MYLKDQITCLRVIEFWGKQNITHWPSWFLIRNLPSLGLLSAKRENVTVVFSRFFSSVFSFYKLDYHVSWCGFSGFTLIGINTASWFYRFMAFDKFGKPSAISKAFFILHSRAPMTLLLHLSLCLSESFHVYFTNDVQEF